MSEEYPLALATRMATRFALEAPIEVYDFAQKGNINQQTFLVAAGTGATRTEYLLQRINDQVFTRPEKVMEAMLACLEAQRRAVDRGMVPAGREWEVISLVSTRAAAPYLAYRDGRGPALWRVMLKIPDSKTFKSLSEIPDRAQQLQVAEEAGRGLALFGDFTSDMDATRLVSPLPGYRDTRVYYDQLSCVVLGHRSSSEAEALLPRDPELRASTQQHFLVHLPDEEYRARLEDPELQEFLELAERERPFATCLLDAMTSGAIRTLAIHGDTKLDNFLFSERSGRVKALVDLDTIMPHTWLVDWGDMVRSLANVAGETERDLSRVRVDREIYLAVARGFLATARKVTRAEVALMAEAVEVIALELGIRFLADYLRGDSYFTLGPTDPPEHNKVRALAQLSLFQKLRADRTWANELLAQLAAAGPSKAGEA